LQQAAAEAAGGSEETCMPAIALASNSKPLCKALKQLASTSGTLWTAAADAAAAGAAAPLASSQPPAAATVPSPNSSSPASYHANRVAPSALQAEADNSAVTAIAPSSLEAAAAVDAEGLKQLLFWTCHLTTAVHKVNHHARASQLLCVYLGLGRLMFNQV
jgi:hypothetical protein